MLTLTATTLDLSGEHSEIRQTFGTNEVSIGRYAECDMVLPDPDRRISRMQARIVHTDGQYVVCNASTSNPMYVNGMELSPGSSQVIGDGDELRAGSYVLAVSLAEEVSPSAQPQHDQRESCAEDAGASANSPEGEQARSNVDPLLALGASEDASGAAIADPFADLSPKAAPIASTSGIESGTVDMAAPPSAMASQDAQEESASEESLPIGHDNSAAGAKPAKLPLTERKPLETSQAIGAAGNTLSVEPRWPSTGDFDRNDPFGDLLTHPLFADGTAATTPETTRSAEPPLSRPDTNAHSTEFDSGQSLPAGSDTQQPAHTWNRLENPFELPVSDSSRTHYAQGEHEDTDLQPSRTGDALENPLALPVIYPSRTPHAQSGYAAPNLSSLAGNPFGDLLGAPVENQIADAPPFDPVASERTTHIPEDFNPLATGGVAQRNSSDPLTPMGVNSKGLVDVIPKSTIDSIYDPGNESPTTLAVDPLQQTHERVLMVEQSVDPLKLFANDGLGLTPSTDIDNSIRNDAREMIASFRAPTPKADPGMLAAEPIGDILASPLASSYESASAADSQIDVGVNVVPAIIPIPPEEDKGNGTSLLPPSPSADLSGASLDVAGSKTVQDSTPPEGAAQRAPDSPAAASLPVLKKPSVDAEKFEGSVEAALMAAFKRGAELEEWSATSVTPELMETLGRLLRTAAQGAVSLLAARAAIKQEIHLSLTLINPKSNNPLKFLPDGHTALLQMLGTRMPGFMAPVDAMQEAFDDLLIHQTAIAAGTQATIEALFRRFDPGVIESQYLKNGTGERLSQAKLYARLWSAYINQYQLINEEIKDDFFKRLGAEFHHAYDREYGQRAKDER